MNGSGTGETGEATSPGRCPTVGQGGPGRHPATARMKWSRDMNIAVMECYYLSKPVDESGRPVRGYRQRMHAVWKERGLPKITEQRLCDQARVIRKNEWFTSLELRTFARKSSNIDFFIKLLLQLGYELLLSEIQKNWGVTDFVSEIRYLKGHPNFEKSVFLTRYGSNVCMSKNIANEFLEQNFLCQFLYEWVY